MFGKICAAIGWLVKEALVMIGLLVVIAVGLIYYKLTNEKPVQKPAGEAVQAQQQVEDETCKCSAGKYCIGKRGGQYCLTDGGSKKYKQSSE